MTTKAQKAEQEEARAYLRERIKPGETLYTVLRHVSRSGMRRHISVIQIDPTGVPRDRSAKVAAALGRRWNRDGDGGVICNGVGMDMGFELVYNLSVALFCPDEYDHDAAYSLTHRWL